MSAPIPVQGPDGRWYVAEHGFDTNAEAWRWLDRQNNEPISRAEDVSDWVFNKMANGE